MTTTPYAPQPTAAELFEWAKRVIGKGFKVLPIYGVKNGVCTCAAGAMCSSPGKHPFQFAKRPATSKNSATDDPDVIQEWLDQGWLGNLALVPGPRHVVLDVDDGEAGAAQMRALQEQYGKLPPTWTQQTGGDGWHPVYSLSTDAPPIGNSNGSLKRLGFDRIHVRGESQGYIIVAPSVHASGKQYAWINDLPVAPLPQEWIDLLAPKAVERPTVEPRSYDGEGRGTSYGLAALAKETVRVREAIEGTRNETLNDASFKIGQLIAGGELDQEYAVHVLLTAAEESLLPTDEATRTTNSGLTAGLEHPRAAPDRGVVSPSPENGRESATPEPEKPAGVESAPIPASIEAPFRLEVLTAREFALLPDPTGEDEIVGPVLRRGQRLLLGGPTGEGKSSLVMQLIRSALNTEDFLGWTPTEERQTALVVDVEQSVTSIKRLHRVNKLEECDDLYTCSVPAGLSLNSDPAHIAEVERIISEIQPTIVLFDPLYKLHDGDSNDERQIVDLMKLFDGWREKYDFALILLVHTRKPAPGARFSLNEFFGSSGLVRGAEVCLGLVVSKPGYSNLYFLKDREGRLPGKGTRWGLFFDADTGFTRDEKHELTTAEKIRELREQNPGITQKQVAEKLEVTERTVKSYWAKTGPEKPPEATAEQLAIGADDEDKN